MRVIQVPLMHPVVGRVVRGVAAAHEPRARATQALPSLGSNNSSDDDSYENSDKNDAYHDDFRHA
jgi:hypothetical protein